MAVIDGAVGVMQRLLYTKRGGPVLLSNTALVFVGPRMRRVLLWFSGISDLPLDLHSFPSCPEA